MAPWADYLEELWNQSRAEVVALGEQEQEQQLAASGPSMPCRDSKALQVRWHLEGGIDDMDVAIRDCVL
jgi:hypothetical protein